MIQENSAPPQEQIVRCSHCGLTLRIVVYPEQSIAESQPGTTRGMVRRPMAKAYGQRRISKRDALLSGAYRFFEGVGRLIS
jgi:hypothetical protein